MYTGSIDLPVETEKRNFQNCGYGFHALLLKLNDEVDKQIHSKKFWIRTTYQTLISGRHQKDILLSCKT
uniref:Uncharacterized protein n=1 Tax=Romanomermis culicivorax TaxID=13658 RepID=A0A915IMR9_ROMCU